MLQQGSPAQIHSALRNARVADLVGIQNRFQGEWLGAAAAPGQGLLGWTGEGRAAPNLPVLTGRDKGKLSPGQAVNWVIPSDGLTIVESTAQRSSPFSAEVVEARHLGEITLATLRLTAVPGAQLVLTLSGAQRQGLSPGLSVGVRLDPALVHVMPSRVNGGRHP